MQEALPHRAVQTVTLLVMTVIQLRQIADEEPDNAPALHQIADQLESEANDLARLSGGE